MCFYPTSYALRGGTKRIIYGGYCEVATSSDSDEAGSEAPASRRVETRIVGKTRVVLTRPVSRRVDGVIAVGGGHTASDELQVAVLAKVPVFVITATTKAGAKGARLSKGPAPLGRTLGVLAHDVMNDVIKGRGGAAGKVPLRQWYPESPFE